MEKLSAEEQRKRTEAGRQARREYMRRKEAMVPYERRNYSKIVFFRGTGEFFVCGGHSAIILYNLIAPELGIKTALKRDTDFEIRFEEGMISIRNLDFFKEKLSKSVQIAGYTGDKDKIIFNLVERMSKETFETLKKSEDTKREYLVNAVSSTKVIPKLYQYLRELVKAVRYKVEKHSDRFAQELYTGHLVLHARGALIYFLRGSREETEMNKALDDVEKSLKLVMFDLIHIEAAEIWRIEECEPISRLTQKALLELQMARKAK